MISPHPGLPDLEYVKFSSVSDACKFLCEHEGMARPFSGGTDIFVRIRNGALKVDYLVDIKTLEGTRELTFNPQKGLTIGAAVTMNAVIAHKDVNEHYPNLVEAARSVASYQLRNRASIIGNICNASPAGDTIGTCIALNGMLNVSDATSTRKIPLHSFFLSPGHTILKKGEIVTSLFLPLPPQGLVGVYKKLGRNTISDLSIVGVTALGYPKASSVSGYRFRIILSSVAPVPFEALKAEAVLSENKITSDTITRAAIEAMNAVTPIDDVRGSARYRKLMVRNLVQEAITEICDKLTN